MNRPSAPLATSRTELQASSVWIRPVAWFRIAVIALIYAAILFPLSQFPRLSGNVWSRYMTIESLVERGTLAIDASPLRGPSGSPDLVRHDGHFYSDKPPVLSVLSALLYAPMVSLGLRFTNSAQQFVAVNHWLVWLVVGLSSAACLAALRFLLQAADVRPLGADVLTLAFGFGSLLLAYAGTFNNHSVAAALLTIGFAIVWDGAHTAQPRHRWLAVMAGLATGLAAVIDLPAGGLALILFSAWLGTRHHGLAGRFLLGSLPPLLLHAALQTWATGSPWPVEMRPELFDFPGSYWQGQQGQWVEPGPRHVFALELLLGPQGWLTVTPALLAGLIAMPALALKRGDQASAAARAALCFTLGLLLYYIWGVRRTDYAGLSFGTRHLLAISPLVFAMGVIGVSRLRHAVVWGLLAAAIVLGMLYAGCGCLDPWQRIERSNQPILVILRQFAVYPWSSYNR